MMMKVVVDLFCLLLMYVITLKFCLKWSGDFLEKVH